VHEALIKSYLGDTLIKHISRDDTAIEARGKPVSKLLLATKDKSEKAHRGRPKKARSGRGK
jgi:hypothetical protein